MSANNWDYCPQCRKNEEVEAAKRQQKAADAYGKVSEAEYQVLLDQAKPRFNGEKMKQTLREDWELGIFSDFGADATFDVNYRAHCSECGFGHEFKISNPVELKN